MSDQYKTYKGWENGSKKWDLQEESRKANDFLDLFGRDQLSYRPETINLRNEHLKRYEAPLAHGYPYTSYLQLGLAYGACVYTA